MGGDTRDVHMISSRSLPRPVRALQAGAVTLAFGAVVFAGAYLLSSTATQTFRPPSAPTEVLPGADLAAGGVSRTDRQIGSLQAKLQQRPDDPKNLTGLAFAYLQKVRETADYSYYTRADALMRQANELRPGSPDTLLGLASLAVSRHQWQEGLDWGQRALAVNPSSAAAYGIVGDAQVELGRYDEAVATFQRMMDLRPGLAAYARASYVRELYGDLPGAIQAMREAADIGAPLGEAGVWTRVQLGHLLLQVGQVQEAEAEYRQALAVDPSNTLAEGGLGRARMAVGDYAGAIPFFERAFTGLPLPEFVLALGDLYQATGRPAEAQQQFELARAIQALYVANGGNADLELALFEAEQGDPARAVAMARAEASYRQSVYVYDVLAWALYQAGDDVAAREASRQALRLGTQDGLILYHAGMIDARLGDTAGAREKLTLALERAPGAYAPRVYAPQARATLRALAAQP